MKTAEEVKREIERLEYSITSPWGCADPQGDLARIKTLRWVLGEKGAGEK